MLTVRIDNDMLRVLALAKRCFDGIA